MKWSTNLSPQLCTGTLKSGYASEVVNEHYSEIWIYFVYAISRFGWNLSAFVM